MIQKTNEFYYYKNWLNVSCQEMIEFCQENCVEIKNIKSDEDELYVLIDLDHTISICIELFKNHLYSGRSLSFSVLDFKGNNSIMRLPNKYYVIKEVKKLMKRRNKNLKIKKIIKWIMSIFG